jgi:hypothetical protein
MIPLVKTLVNGEQRQENGFALQNHRHSGTTNLELDLLPRVIHNSGF